MNEIDNINDQKIIELFIRKDGKVEINNIKKLNKHLYSIDIENYIKNRFNDSTSYTETINRIYHKIYIRPICPVCHNDVYYLGGAKYRKHCSTKCSSLDKEVQQKLKTTNLQKYGCDIASKSTEIKEKIKQTFLTKFGTTSPLLNEQIKEKTKQTKLEKYGDENYTNRKKANNTIKKKYGDLMFKTTYFKEKVKENNLKKYGVEHSSQREEIKQKIKQTNIIRYGGTAPIHSNIIKQKIQQTLYNKTGYLNPYQIPEIHKKGIMRAQDADIKKKRKQTCIDKYGVDNYWKTKQNIEKSHSKEANKKRNETKRKNGTFNTSIPEKKSYELLKEIFPDVLYQYKSDVYPFACDFYIPSLDLYIECNYHWTHGGKPFEDNESDKLIIENWKAKNTQYYMNAINTWTKLDVKKRTMAKENKLNYLEFWNIEELKEWLKNYF